MADQERNDNSATPEQMGDLLRMLLEKHDQNKFAKRTDGGAKIPGKDVIETVLNGEKLPAQGILVHAEVRKGYEGVIGVYCYDEIKDVSINDSRPRFDEVRMHIRLGSSRELTLAYENPNYSYKEKEPFNRMQTTSYIGFAFNDLDLFDLSDHGRLLVVKHALESDVSGTTFDRRFEDIKESNDTREVTVVFENEDFVGACEAVSTIMSKLIGAQDVDSELAAAQVELKLKK